MYKRQTCYEAVLASSLNGLGKQTAAARNSLICGAVQLIVTWVRMGQPGIGLRGYVEGLLISTVLGVWLNWRSVSKAIGLKPLIFQWMVAPGLAALLSGLCVNLLFPTLLRSGLEGVPAGLVCLVFGVVLYLCALIAQGALPRKK